MRLRRSISVIEANTIELKTPELNPLWRIQ